MVELKSPWLFRRHDFVARTVRLLPDDAVVVSFSRAAILRDATAPAQPAHRAARRLRDLDPAQPAASRGPRASTTPASTARGIAKATALGLKALVYTVNEPARMLALRELGVDGIFTDYPGLAREALARRPG